jgi:hypothetical protein
MLGTKLCVPCPLEVRGKGIRGVEGAAGKEAYTVEDLISGSPNDVITEGQFGIVVPKATTAVSNFLTMCAVVNGS